MNKSKAAEFVIRNVRTEAKPREQKEAKVLHRIHLNKSERLVAFDEIDAIFSYIFCTPSPRTHCRGDLDVTNFALAENPDICVQAKGFGTCNGACALES